MKIDQIEEIMNGISKGDTSFAEALFEKPGGRKYLESVVLIIVCSLPYIPEEKENVFVAFRKALDKIEKRIKRQKEGQKILRQVYN